MAYIDIENALQEMLNAEGYNACAKPLPAGFVMPHVLVDMLNASDDNAAQAIYNVDFDCRASSYSEAAQLQCEIANLIRSFEGADIGGVPCYKVDTLRILRLQPDASNENAILATVSAGLRLRVAD